MSTNVLHITFSWQLVIIITIFFQPLLQCFTLLDDRNCLCLQHVMIKTATTTWMMSFYSRQKEYNQTKRSSHQRLCQKKKKQTTTEHAQLIDFLRKKKRQEDLRAKEMAMKEEKQRKELELRQKEFEASQQERQGMLILMNTMMQTMQHVTKK